MGEVHTPFKTQKTHSVKSEFFVFSAFMNTKVFNVDTPLKGGVHTFYGSKYDYFNYCEYLLYLFNNNIVYIYNMVYIYCESVC